MNRLFRTVLVSLVACSALSACGAQVAPDKPGGGPVAAPTTSSAATTTTTTTSAPAPAPPSRSTTTTTTTTTSTRRATTSTSKAVSASTVLAEFKALVKQKCAPAYTGGDTHNPMPTAVSAKLRSGSKWVIRDDLNPDLPMLFDRAKRIVTSTEGPQQSLPMEYTFQCDPEVFIGPVS